MATGAGEEKTSFRPLHRLGILHAGSQAAGSVTAVAPRLSRNTLQAARPPTGSFRGHGGFGWAIQGVICRSRQAGTRTVQVHGIRSRMAIARRSSPFLI